ncbi:MAG: ABC transporter permease [Acidobacteria bacterium]|nr:ABC transporter permease [Acidobacteriota bacterium]
MDAHGPLAPRGRQRTIVWIDLLGAVLLGVLATTGIACLVVPTLIVVITSFDTQEFIGFPPRGFSLERYREMFQSSVILRAAQISAVTSAFTVTLGVALGVPAAIALVRREFRGKALVTALLLSPIMLPGIVIGVAMLVFYSALGLRLSLPLLVLSHVVFTMPFIVRLSMARMERIDRQLEDAARNLGAREWQVFRHVVLPQLRPGIAAGAAFAFLVSFDNLSVSLFTAPVRQRPLPIELFYLMRFDLDPVVAAVAALQFLIALCLLLFVARKLGPSGFMPDA